MEIENNKNDESEKQVSSDMEKKVGSDMEKKTKREELILDIIGSLLLFAGVGGIFTTATGWIITDKFNFDIFVFLSFFAGRQLLRREVRGKDSARILLGLGLFLSIFSFVILLLLFISFPITYSSFKLTDVVTVLGFKANLPIFPNGYIEAIVGFFLLGVLIWGLLYSFRFLKRKTVVEKFTVVGRRNNLVNVVITLACICSITEFYTAFVVRKSLVGIRGHEITVVAVDKDTGEKLPISVNSCSTDNKQKLYSNDVKIGITDGGTSLILNWISNRGTEVSICSRGYCQKKVTLPIDESNLTVKLTKCTHR